MRMSHREPTSLETWRAPKIPSMVIAAFGLLACASTFRNPRRTSTVARPGSVGLAYECGNRFRVRRTAGNPVQLRWTVEGTSDSGHVFLGHHRSGFVQTDASFVTRAPGAVSIWDDGLVVASAANDEKACATPRVAPVAPVAPESISTPIWKAFTSDSNVVNTAVGTRMVRNALYLAFNDGTDDDTRATAVSAVQGEIVGGIPLGPLGTFIVRIPYQLDSPLDSADGPIVRARALLGSQRGVRVSGTINVDPAVRPDLP